MSFDQPSFGQAACIAIVGILCFDIGALGHFGRPPGGGSPDLAIFISTLLPIFTGLKYKMELAGRKALLLRSINELHVQSLTSANAALTRMTQLDLHIESWLPSI
jgi:hypothetical protein